MSQSQSRARRPVYRDSDMASESSIAPRAGPLVMRPHCTLLCSAVRRPYGIGTSASLRTNLNGFKLYSSSCGHGGHDRAGVDFKLQ